MNPGFWRGRSVLVTGHTGFKGGWLSLWMQQLGAKVSGYALQPPTSPSLFETARVASGMDSVQGDIRDLPALRAVLERSRPEVVFHLAAQALVRRSYAEPLETLSVNVLGTATVLEAVRLAGGVRAVVVVTSDKCYDNREWVWGYRESDPVGGHDPYSSSKGCAELVAAAYRSSFFAPNAGAAAVATVRAGNVIGGGDWSEDRLVPDVMRAFLGGRPAPIRNPRSSRPWQHVLEPVHGYLALAERLCEAGLAFAEAWNFGPRAEGVRSVEWVVEHLRRLWGDPARWELTPDRGPHEAHSLTLDSAKAERRLGWAPRLSLEEALRWTVEWYQAHRAGRDLRGITVEQIGRFQEAAAR